MIKFAQRLAVTTARLKGLEQDLGLSGVLMSGFGTTVMLICLLQTCNTMSFCPFYTSLTVQPRFLPIWCVPLLVELSKKPRFNRFPDAELDNKVFALYFLSIRLFMMFCHTLRPSL